MAGGHAVNLPDGAALAADMQKEFEKQRAVLEIKRQDEKKKEELLLLLLLLLPSMMSVMRRHLIHVATDSMNRTLDALNIKDIDKRRQAMDEMERRLTDRIEWAANEINQTTAEELEAAIANELPGMEEQAISTVFENATTVRSELIGVTESVFAYHAGVIAAAEESEEPLFKRWITQASACAVCLELEAEGPIPLDALFGDEFEAPGAHPNCVCSIELTTGD